MRGLTLTPILTMDDFSSDVSDSFTNAHPIDVVPRSRPRIFFMIKMCSVILMQCACKFREISCENQIIMSAIECNVFIWHVNDGCK